ncbi:hypothetical protein ABE55_22025 [Bacillus thuringiensis]|uniref:hypothetical protein n=1 Tax=Bacillus cereus group TaxID=86661 RepID=UPI000818C1F8|nr:MULTISPECIES: hypothetical protein [Bacillus cereus group]WIV94927.1 hypothetical protein QNH49_10510 [Bacillus bombysepticus]EKS8377831.1 hypothetical protein [Bacillus cereus]EKS8384064.1 hypothetical protein [Bacillus cereus]EMA7397383.1 hypothetical protein [Bacillus cereus]MBG9469152.1 hypothetical protein [Bacillus thuringiensis]
MFNTTETPLGSIRTYENWYVAKDVLMSTIGYRSMTDLLAKIDDAEQGYIQMPAGYKLRVLTDRGLQQFFERTNSTKSQFSIMREWFVTREKDRGEDAIQLYLNGCVLYGMAVSLWLMRVTYN